MEIRVGCRKSIVPRIIDSIDDTGFSIRAQGAFFRGVLNKELAYFLVGTKVGFAEPFRGFTFCEIESFILKEIDVVIDAARTVVEGDGIIFLASAFAKTIEIFRSIIKFILNGLVLFFRRINRRGIGDNVRHIQHDVFRGKLEIIDVFHHEDLVGRSRNRIHLDDLFFKIFLDLDAFFSWLKGIVGKIFFKSIADFIDPFATKAAIIVFHS